MPKQKRKPLVREPTPQCPEQVRRIGRAVIALAQAQREADAQAEAEGRKAKPPTGRDGPTRLSVPPSGDAA